MVSIRPERTADAPDPASSRPDSRRARREQARAGVPSLGSATVTVTERPAPTRSSTPGQPPASTPGEGRQRRRVRARRPRAAVGPVPVATLVWLEVALVAGGAAVLAVGVTARAVGAGVALLALLLAAPVRGMAVSGQIARRLRFAGTRHTVPGRATLASARTRSGRAIGTLDHPPTVAVVVRVGPGRSRLLRVGAAPRVPLGRIARRLASAGITHDSVSLVHDLEPGRAEGRVHLVVRVDPTQAREALEIRGGGRAGLEATLAALAGHVESVLRQSGLSAETLDLDALERMEADAAGIVGTDGASETWRALTTSMGTHRVLAMTALSAEGDLAALAPEVAATVAVRWRAEADGPAATRVAVRFSDARASAAQQGAGDLPGVALATATGLQRHGVLETTVLGSPEPMGESPRPWLDRWPVLDLPTGALDRLAPQVGGGVPLGVSADGVPVALVEDASVARTLVALGDGWLATTLVGLLARSGRRVTVATSRPAPWRALAAQVGPLVEVVETVAGTPLPRGVGDVVVDDVQDGQGTTPAQDPMLRRPGRLGIVVRPQADGVDPGLLRAADVVLATASGLPAPDLREALLGPGSAPPSAPSGIEAGEVFALEAGQALVLRLHAPA